MSNKESRGDNIQDMIGGVIIAALTAVAAIIFAIVLLLSPVFAGLIVVSFLLALIGAAIRKVVQTIFSVVALVVSLIALGFSFIVAGTIVVGALWIVAHLPSW